MENSIIKATLSTLVSFYDDYELNTLQERRLAERDRDYTDNKQLTEAEEKTLIKRKQPVIIINRIKPKVDFLLGMERQTRTDPRAFPRTPNSDEAAEAATDAIRFVCDNNDFDQVASQAFDNMLVEGTCAGEINVEFKNGKFEIVISHYKWDRLFYDIHGRDKSYQEVKYKGIVMWMHRDDAIQKFKDKKHEIESSITDGTSYTDTFDDAPRNSWIDTKNNRLKICLVYFIENGKWHYAYFTFDYLLTEIKLSPYLDEFDDPQCPLEFQSSHMDRDGYPFGEVRALIGSQDGINKSSSKFMHLVNTRQTYSNKSAVPSEKVAELKAQIQRPDGHLEFNHGEYGKDFGILPTQDMAQMQLQLFDIFKQEIDAIGANAALSGKEERVMSGRALQARQQSGTMELGVVFDSHRAWKRRVYRQIWNRIKQYWDDERWIRVTDNEENLKWVGLNKPITLAEQMQENGFEIPPELQNDPRLQEIVDTKNNVAKIDVDIIIEESPDIVNLQSEQFDLLAKMYNANPQSPASPQGIPWEKVIKASSLRNKKELIEGEEQSPEEAKAQQESNNANQEMQARHHKMEMAEKEAVINVKQADAAKKTAEAEKTKIEGLRILNEPMTDIEEKEQSQSFEYDPFSGNFS